MIEFQWIRKPGKICWVVTLPPRLLPAGTFPWPQLRPLSWSWDPYSLTYVQRFSDSQKLTRVRSISDTTGPSLMLLWFFLASYPEHAEKIYGELSSIDTHDLGALAALPHFNGVINESMRLFPAALTTGSRLTPPEGLHIDGTFIPGATKITAPRYSVFRR